MSRVSFRLLPARISALIILGFLVIAACGEPTGAGSEVAIGSDSISVQSSAAPHVVLRGPSPEFRGRGARGSAAADVLGEVAPPAPQPGTQPGEKLIRNGSVLVRVDSLEPAIDAVRKLAADLGGFVGNVSVNTGEFEVRNASLQLRIPSDRFDEALGGMAPLGKVEHSSTTVLDVGEEYVDLTTRMANSKRLEARLVQLLGSRTGSLDDVLAVERELARVREEIERREARLRFLDSRVALSTIDVNLSERAPVVGSSPGQSIIGQAFVGAWRNFVGFVALVIESLGVVIPVLLVGWLIVRLLRRRSRRREPA